jgi:hypothetical protein
MANPAAPMSTHPLQVIVSGHTVPTRTVPPLRRQKHPEYPHTFHVVSVVSALHASMACSALHPSCVSSG